MTRIDEKIASLRQIVRSGVEYSKPTKEKLEVLKKHLQESEEAKIYLKTERGLADDTIDYFQLGYDPEKNAIAIPNFKNGELINIMYRHLVVEGRQSKYTQEKDCEVWIYHEQGIDTALKRGAVLIVEGQFDCMSAWQSGIKNVVSVGSGKDSYGAWVELLDPIPEVYIAYDNDKAGKEASYKFAERVGVERSKEIVYPEGIKDANDYFKKYKKDDFRILVLEARPFYTRRYNDLQDVISLLREDSKEKLRIDILPEVKISDGHLVSISAGTNVGKCLKKGTEVIMYDGSLKKVEDIVVGDLLMGEDSKPKQVLALGNGKEEMYRISGQGEYYEVNKSHILSLKYLSKDYHEMSVEEYLQIPEHKRFKYRGWKTGVDFKEQHLSIDPYFLGIWLGDGTAKDTTITNRDKEIIDYIYSYGKSISLNITKLSTKNRCSGFSIVSDRGTIGSNTLLNEMKKYNLIGNKHIPQAFKINSRENRLQLLAGLLDTDGYLSKNERGECYEIIQKSKELAEDIVFLARSLGFRAVMKKTVKGIASIGFLGEYYRIHIVGDLSIIPNKIGYKKSNFKHKKNWLTYKIAIEPIGIDEYYGFTLDGNGLFLLRDFTVTHNTQYVLNIAKKLTERGIPTLILPFERGIQVVGSRFIQILADKSEEELRQMDSADWDKLIKKLSTLPAYFSLPNPAELLDVLSKAKKILGIKAVIVDHLDYMIRNQGEREDIEIRNRLHELKSFAIQEEMILFIVTHTRRIHQAGVDSKKKPTMHDIRGSSAVEQDSEVVVILDKVSDTEMEVDVQKNKGKMVSRLYSVDYSTGVIGDEIKRVTFEDF